MACGDIVTDRRTTVAGALAALFVVLAEQGLWVEYTGAGAAACLAMMGYWAKDK